MCGIFGLSRATESSIPDGIRLILAGLVAIEARGPDSTGVAWTRGKAQKVWYHKLVGPATKVAGHLDIGGRARIHSAIGHARWASQGAVNYTNAHPVVAEHIVLVHNGVLSNDDDLVDLAGLKRVGEVDSWAIAALLASQSELGADHPAELLELVEGDAAIAWFDTDDPGAMHLARLEGRPLTIGWTKKGDLVMSSTRQTLERTSRLSGVAINDMVDVKQGTYLRVRAGRVEEWRPIKLPRRKPVVTVQRPLWTPTKGSPAPKRAMPRGYAHGITDLFDTTNRSTDWWDEAERLLGDAVGERPTFEWDDEADTSWPTFDDRMADDDA